MLNIFLTNLGKYNEGELVGEWIQLPISEEELEAVKERIGINERYEEMFITDYESDIHGLTIGEYDSIDDLNKLAEVLEDTEPEIIEALIYNGYYTAEEISEKLDSVYYIGDTTSSMDIDEVIGYYYGDELGSVAGIPEHLQAYFDYKRYGRDIKLNGNFYETANGKVYEIVR